MARAAGRARYAAIGQRSADLRGERLEQAGDRRQPLALLVEDRAERIALEAGDRAGRQRDALGQRRDDDLDQPVGAVEAAPQIVVLAIGAAEEGAEAGELDALERGGGAARADRGGIVGRDAIDLDRLELLLALGIEQGQRGDVVEGEAEIGEQRGAARALGQRGERRRPSARRPCRRPPSARAPRPAWRARRRDRPPCAAAASAISGPKKSWRWRSR